LNRFLVLSEEEARTKILGAVPTLATMKVPLQQAANRFSATDLVGKIPLPSFDNSAMDGYAVIARSATKGARLKIVGDQPAGVSRNLRVREGEAIRIFTGAPLPAGADAVVMQEETEREGSFVLIRLETVVPGEFVRKTGADLALGQQILRRGDRVSLVTLPLLASQGIESIDVHERARVAIVTTGDELVAPGGELRPGEIFETNGVMLSALAEAAGANVITQCHCRDEFEELCATLSGATDNDVVIISGGVSVGERDLVRDALRKIGAQIDLWRVAVKPGKPFLFGMRERCAIFGLPGNPVSSFVTFLIFVRPALLRMMGAKDLTMTRSLARLSHDIAGDEIRPHYLRGKMEEGRFSIVGQQESHALFGLARANVLLRVDPGQRLTAGSEVEVLLLD
jgi:molybdopterin molybdotransferase